MLGLAALRVRMCPFAFVFGVPCPGCGLARATLALCRGDLRAALALHPLVFVAVPAAVVAALHATSSLPTSPSRERAVAVGSAALLLLLLVVWAARFAGALGGPVAIQ